MGGVRNLPLAVRILTPAEGWTAPRRLPTRARGARPFPKSGESQGDYRS